MITALILAPQILKLIGTPEEVLPKSLVYFRVYFMGSLGFVLYNFGMGILQSLGYSKSPVTYLISADCGKWDTGRTPEFDYCDCECICTGEY